MFIDWTVWDTEDMEEFMWKLNVADIHIDICRFSQTFNENVVITMKYKCTLHY